MEQTLNNPKFGFLRLYLSYLLFFQYGRLKSDFYCGITKDLEERRRQHNVDHYVATVKMSSSELARQVETEMHNKGFDTGGQLGNGKDKSVYVYLYRKIPGVTKE